MSVFQKKINSVFHLNLFDSEDPTGVAASMLSTIWNFLPQYTDVEIRKNFNKLKSGFDVAHFMSRDTVVVR